MPRYRIDVIAKNKTEAADKILEYIADPHSTDIYEVEKETNWKDYSNMLADETFEEFESLIIESIIEDCNQEAYEIMDQHNIKDRIWETCNGIFIYTNPADIIDALRLLRDYGSHTPDEPSFWEGKIDYWDIINAQATYTMESLVFEKVENLIDERIAEHVKEHEEDEECEK